MIDPKDLRIGNYIMDEDGQLCIINGFMPLDHSIRCDEEEGCQICIDVIKSDGGINKGWITDSTLSNPIPLTTEWLMKLGLEKKIILGNASGYWYAKDGLSYNESHKGWWFRGSFPDGPLYVHELQNLYYWLNNKKELEFKNIN